MHDETTVRMVYEDIVRERTKYYVGLGYHEELARRKANIIAVQTAWKEYNMIQDKSCLFC